MKNKAFAFLAVLLCLSFNQVLAEEFIQEANKYPDYAWEYLGPDKFEKFNRKMFSFNSFLNKYALRPVHIIWASVMPKYGQDRIQSATNNIEYPIRLMSTLLQRDFKASGKETLRFLTNTTIGLGGLFDPAESLFNIKPVDEDMDQALAKCKIKQGPYLVMPVLASTSPRGLIGKALDTALNPSSYIATPVLALVKAGLFVNRTSQMQPLNTLVESNYADPYDIARKAYGLHNYIKCENLDRKEVLEASGEIVDETVNAENNIALNDEENDVILKVVPAERPVEANANVVKTDEKENSEELAVSDILQGKTTVDDIILKSYDNKKQKLMADMLLPDYNPQNPVVDAMRTALFDLPGIDDSIWTDLSIWNRCFAKRIKTDAVAIENGRDEYKFRYILQKDKNSPLAIIYPSIGEGITSHHSVVLAKLFYDEGYSVIIQGSHFQWEFVKSMPSDYKPGLPSQDADYLKIVTSKIIKSLEAEHKYQFGERVLIGTSFGAMTTLFVAQKEAENNTLNISKYISINPPIELLYAMKQIDTNNEEWQKDSANLKNRVALCAAKILQIYKERDENPDVKIDSLPFTEQEGKLITGFIMHQKLSDLVFALENVNKTSKCPIYKDLNNMSYRDYAEKYLLAGNYKTIDDLNFNTSLYSIADYLRKNTNYKIYHTLDDYLVNTNQLRQLKQCCGKNAVLIDHGSHLGFLYRQEFIDALKKDIALNKIEVPEIISLAPSD